MRTVLSTGSALFVVGCDGRPGPLYGLLAEAGLALLGGLVIMARISRIRWDASTVKDALRFCWRSFPARWFLNITAVSDG